MTFLSLGGHEPGVGVGVEEGVVEVDVELVEEDTEVVDVVVGAAEGVPKICVEEEVDDGHGHDESVDVDVDVTVYCDEDEQGVGPPEGPSPTIPGW